MSINRQAITYLEARLTEGEEFAKAAEAVPQEGQRRRAAVDKNYMTHWGPARVLAEIEAQRQILKEYKKFDEVANEAARVPGGDASLVAALAAGLELAVRIHLAVHSDRSDFGSDWLT